MRQTLKGFAVTAVFLSMFAIYLFIAVGFMAKATLKEKLDEKTLVLLSIFFLQPFLNFWGLMQRPIDSGLAYAPLLYLAIVFLLLPVIFLLGRQLFADIKQRSIFIVSGIVGNTANLGIPVGIVIFGEESIPYTTVINIANVFFVYTVGVYFYSRGNFSVRESLLNIVKLPVLWSALLAIACNLAGITLHPSIDRVLEMGAYASIVMQLLIFGIYLHSVRVRSIAPRLIAGVHAVKFVLLPLVALAVLLLVDLDPMIKGILFLELLMPLAIANVNFASLYDCRPADVTVLILMSSVLFMGIVFGGIRIVQHFGWL